MKAGRHALLITCGALLCAVGLAGEHAPTPAVVAVPTFPKLSSGGYAAGEVVVQVSIGADGRVKSAVASTGPERLRQSAEAAANLWRFVVRGAGEVIASLTFAFIVEAPSRERPVVSSRYVAPGRVEIIARAHELVVIEDPPMVDTTKAKRE